MKSFILDGEKTVQELLSKLTFISKIKPHEKINVNTMTLSDDSVPHGVYRYYHHETRHTTLEFIKKILSDAIDIASEYLFREERFFRQLGCMILEKIEESKKGIRSLEVTYGEDRMYISTLDTLLKTLEVKVEDLKKRVKVKKYKNETGKDTSS